MAFVNEYVPEEDVKKYGLEEINERYLKANIGYHWTIDRERDIYLRLVRSGREEFADQQDFTLCWQGKLLEARLTRRGGGERGGKGWTHWSLIYLDMPENMQDKRSGILDDLKDALRAYKDFGMLSATKEHTATFDF